MTTKFSVRLPDDLADKLEAAAQKRDESVSGVAGEAILAYAKRRKSLGAPSSTTNGQAALSPDDPEVLALQNQLAQIQTKLETLQSLGQGLLDKQAQQVYSDGLAQLSHERYEAEQRLLHLLDNPHLFGQTHFPKR